MAKSKQNSSRFLTSARWLAVVYGCASFWVSAFGAPHPLDRAQRFAESITNDENDRARSLARVASAWIEAGEPDRAAAVLAESERQHWATIAAMCDVAAEWAVRGELEKARAWVSEARQRTNNLRGSGRDRALLRMMRALVALGEEDIVRTMSVNYEQLRDYRGEALVLRARALAQKGKVEEAFTLLEPLRDDAFYDNRVWYIRGYVQLARQLGLGDNRYGALLRKGWDDTEIVPDHQRFLLQMDVVECWLAAGDRDEAGRRIEACVAGMPRPESAPHLFAAPLARAALLAARAGRADAAKAWIARVEQLAELVLEIERPELYALGAEARLANGDRDGAVAGYHRAIEAATALVNPRPRALAGIAIALSLQRSGLVDERLEEALDRLERSFGL